MDGAGANPGCNLIRQFAANVGRSNNRRRVEGEGAYPAPPPRLFSLRLPTVALIYSWFIFEMNLVLISLGQTASHSRCMVQFPNPSLSIASTILRTRSVRSGWPWGSSAR